MNIPKNGVKPQEVSFSGHAKKLDDSGLETHRFYYLYDNKKYSCDLELYNITQDKDTKNIQVEKRPAAVFAMKDAPFLEQRVSNIDNLNLDLGFAYRFKLTDKKTNEVSYAFDNGSVAGIFDTTPGNQYNIVLNNRATINKNGPMQLIMPDEYYPGVERNIDGSLYVADGLRAKARKAVRNHANRLGGGFKGIIKKLQDGSLRNEGIRRIVGTPFTKDSISSHLYWTENAYQVAPTLGNENDFKQLQVELFKNGINWIADAALVNEGFGGIHMSEFLRKGQDSISKNMFRVESDVVSLGILPDEASKKGFTSMKLINTPFSLSKDGEYEKENPDYDPSKPTYIQFYDNRLASNDQKVSGTSFDSRSDAQKEKMPNPPFDLTTYAKTNTDNIYDITKHYDAVYPFYLEVSPEELQRNVENIYKSSGKLNLSDISTIKQISNFSTFKVENKAKAADIEFWDGNVDIAKLNFFTCTKDDTRFDNLPTEEAKIKAAKEFQKGTFAVREYAVNSGKYWTQLTSDIQLAYASKLLSESHSKTADDYLNAIEQGVKEGALPPYALEVVNKSSIENVLNGNYHLNRLHSLDIRDEINPEDDYNDYQLSDYILRKTMDVPLETLPVSTNLMGILTSPYMSKKPNAENEIAVSRYDLYKAGNPNLPSEYARVYNETEKLYSQTIVPLITDILSDIHGLTDDYGMVSDYGKYVISEAAPDLLKYILIHSLDNSAKTKINKDGTIDFTSVNDSNITMQSLGIPFDRMTAEEEAQTVLDSISKGIQKIKEPDKLNELKNAMNIRFSNRTENDFKIAEMLMDRTESGLGWRIDAAKDVASMDSVRTKNDNMSAAWKDTIEVWKLFNQSVLKVNPHAYTTAELTDLAELFGGSSTPMFNNDADAERKFLQETGITSVANYNYFFSLLPVLFQPDSIENGNLNDSWMSKDNKTLVLRQKLDEGWAEDWKVKQNGEKKINPGFLFESAEDGVVNSYTFVGNHDKPRVLHGLALDMALFHSDFAKGDAEHPNPHRAIAAEVLQLPEKDIDFDKVSSQAIAMGHRLNEAFKKALDDIYGDYSLYGLIDGIPKEELHSELKNSVSKLATGNYLDRNEENKNQFDPLAFGTRPFDIAIKTVLDELDYLRGKNTAAPLNNKLREKLASKTLGDILTPAYDRFFSIYKLMTVLPGSPTDFAGDRVGTSGYETKCKNEYQQNRNTINWEWLENDDYRFIRDAYKQLNDIAKLRSNPKLSALNDGATITLPIDNPSNPSDFVQGLIRYNDSGSVVLSFIDNKGSETPLDKRMKRGTVIAKDKLYLFDNKEKTNQGLKHGISVGTVFKNPIDMNSKYTVKEDTKGYYLEKTVNGIVQPISIDNDDFNTLLLYKD